MNATIAYILKILSQTEISLDDLQLYLNIEKNSIIKTIIQINKYLESNELPLIEKNDNMISLTLNEKERDKLFDSFSSLTSDERVDYLYIKFIAYGFLNLEKEKQILDISRSTINRTFQHVREDFLRNGTKYEYLHRKGLIIKKIGSGDRELFCRRVMKLFTDEKILVPSLKGLLNEITKFDVHKRTKQIYNILKESNKLMNYMLVSYIFALEVYSDLFSEPIYENKDYDKMKEYINIKSLITSHGSDFSENFKQQLTLFLTQLTLDYYSISKSAKIHTQLLYKDITKELKLNKTDKHLKDLLLQNIYFAFFKYENKIIKNRNIAFNKNEKRLLKILNTILEKNKLEMFLGDKFLIILDIKKILIEDNLSEIKNVLLLFDELNLGNNESFQENLMKIAPNINFDMGTAFFHKNEMINNSVNYDLILSDEKISPEITIMNFYSDLNLQAVLHEEAFKVGLKKLEK